MRHILSIFLIVFVFIGCTMKEQVVEIKYPNTNQVNKKPISNIGKEIKLEDKIAPLEPIDIIESNISVFDNKEQAKIAIIYPSSLVAKYAKTSISTVSGYFAYRNIDINLKVIDSVNENIESIQSSFDQLKQLGIQNVIALYTPRAIYNLHQADSSGLKVYLPLLEKKEVQLPNENFIYGAISYEKQINKLLSYSNHKKTMFYQESFLGYKLKAKFENIVDDFLIKKEITKSRNNFRSLVKDYRFSNSTLFLNTDNVKTSILLSQLRAYNIYPKVIMSTQVNYDPLLFSLTQTKDMERFIVANSIDDVDPKLVDDIDTFGGNITYEWVDYSTLVGTNYLYDYNNSNIIKTQIVDNEVIYEPRLFKTVESSFLEIK